MKETIYDFFTDESIRSTDTLLFYYSSHGIPDTDGDVYLASSDINPRQPFRKGFSFSRLTDMMNRSISTRMVAMLDCCYSGAAKLSKGSENDAAKRGTTAIENKSKLLEQEEGKCILAASQAAQEAYGKRTEDHSIFTYYLLDGLKENEKSVDIYGDITVDTLGIYVYDSIMNSEQKKLNQKPVRKVEAGGKIVLAHYPKLAKSEDSLLKLLKGGNVAEFNKITKTKQSTGVIEHGYLLHERKFSHRLNFGGEEIDNVDLTGVDLHEADICRTILDASDFTNAILYWSNLATARARRAIFRGANLQSTYLSKVDLAGADLSGADLSRAVVIRADLDRTKLSEAKFSNSILVGCREYDNLECTNADFKDAIIDNNDLVEYFITHNAKNVPPAVRTHEELKSKLEEKGYSGRIMEKILGRSLY